MGQKVRLEEEKEEERCWYPGRGGLEVWVKKASLCPSTPRKSGGKSELRGQVTHSCDQPSVRSKSLDCAPGLE